MDVAELTDPFLLGAGKIYRVGSVLVSPKLLQLRGLWFRVLEPFFCPKAM